MTNAVVRLYATAIAALAFFVSWAAVAARPWAASKPSAAEQLVALREQALRRETLLVNSILRERAALRLAAQRRQATAAPAPTPAVRIVTLPPLTVTRTS